jgi:hypothetical protein
MLSGLAEYMRVIRSIVASIGDLLLLDESALLTIDTWTSTWCSLSILEKPLESEKKWKEIQKLSGGTSLMTKADDTLRVEEIRSKAITTSSRSGGLSSKTRLCELTLQALSPQDIRTTRAEVSFQGKCFMACSANLLANRCPFFVVGHEC